MTEKEKMLNGKPYKAFGEELLGERQYAKELLFEYNTLHPKEIDNRNEIIKKLFGKIGDNVLFAPNVSLFTAGHPIHPELRNAGIEYAFPITIGNNVWIGGNVIINPGITIGDNVVIGSGSVITKDIPSNSIAVGNPCKTIREITDEDKNYYFKQLKIGLT